jgi:hypothetical protein
MMIWNEREQIIVGYNGASSSKICMYIEWLTQ